MMHYLEIKEFDLKLSGKSGKYQGISLHELAGNPDCVWYQLCGLKELGTVHRKGSAYSNTGSVMVCVNFVDVKN